MTWGLAERSSLDLHVLRDRNPTFVRLKDGSIRDGYTLKIANRGFEPAVVSVAFEGPAGVRLKTPGQPAAEALAVEVPANEVRAVRVFATAPAAALTASNLPAAFVVGHRDDVVRAKTQFLSGAANIP
jgi:polyferredoxin